MEYEAAVSELTKIADSNWQIGEIADSVEPKYGERTLARLAGDTGIGYETLKECRSVWRAYRGTEVRTSNPWSVYKVFQAQPDRAELVQKEWTVAGARAEVARRDPKPEPGEDPGANPGAHDWAIRARASVGRALRNAGEPSHGDVVILADILGMIMELLDPDVYRLDGR